MTQTAIPYLFMRGGTSRGPYFNRAHLPEDRETLARVLIAAVGAGHPLNIDGLGGGNPVTTKVAMLSPATTDDCDVDYLFAQVAVEEQLVDFKPTCGNILTGVPPAAIEMGLVRAKDPETPVRIHAVNTGAKVRASVQTPQGRVVYAGDTAIDGVPGTAAPIGLQFLDVTGSVTGKLLPTGNPQDTIEGIAVTCLDVAMPMVIARAADFGLTGYESVAELNKFRDFFARMEAVRLAAALKMGMGDARTSVTPKFGLLAPAQHGGAVAARYFMPWTTHPTMAVTGGQCLASCLMMPGSVAEGLVQRPTASPCPLRIEHPSGFLDVLLEWSHAGAKFAIHSAGLVRTARKLASGEVYIPASIWPGKT